MENTDLISLSSSIASLILAVLAIALSIGFFRMTSQLSTSAKEAAKGIGASVERLEKLFDTLYADTFSMMRDTVSDMRKHIWPDESGDTEKLADEAEKRAEKKVGEVKKNIDKDLAKLLQRQEITDVKLTAVRDEMSDLIDRAISDSRRVEVEAREETARRHIMRKLRRLLRLKRSVTAENLVESLGGDVPAHIVIRELHEMANDGLIELSDEAVQPTTEIAIVHGKLSS